MKYDKKEPETMDADPMRLLVSAILAFTVMLFINGFVGSMGGFPAFVAFTLVFFRIRHPCGNGKRRDAAGIVRSSDHRTAVVEICCWLSGFMGNFKNCVSDLPGHRLGKYQWSFRSGICTADVEHIAFGKMGIFFCGDDHVCVCAFTVSACCNPGKGAVDSLCTG